MKKVSILVIIMLVLILLCGCSLVKRIKNGSDKEVKRTEVYMLPNCDHHLTMIFNELLKNFVCRDDIYINLKDIKGRERGSFAMDKHIYMESLEINGISTALNEVFYFEPKDFGASVRPFRLTQVKRDCKVYEFEYGKKDITSDSVALTIRYTINPLDDFDFCKISKGSFKLNGNYVWFPNNLADSVNVNLEVITSASYTVMMNNKLLPFVSNSSYLKIYQAVIKDNFKPLTLIGEKRR